MHIDVIHKELTSFLEGLGLVCQLRVLAVNYQEHPAEAAQCWPAGQLHHEGPHRIQELPADEYGDGLSTRMLQVSTFGVPGKSLVAAMYITEWIVMSHVRRTYIFEGG